MLMALFNKTKKGDKKISQDFADLPFLVIKKLHHPAKKAES